MLGALRPRAAPTCSDARGLLGLQRVAGNAGVSAMLEEERSPVHDVVTSGGKAAGSRGAHRHGGAGSVHDFGDVRVHDDTAAASSAQSVNAHAYTVGSNIVFQRDIYDPSSEAGRTTLAHELTHVVQQRSGPVDGTAAAGRHQGQRPGRPVRAGGRRQRRAGDVRPGSGTARCPRPEPRCSGTAEDEDDVQGSFAGVPDLQRQEGDEEEEEPVQGLFVQREGEEEEEELPA